MTASTETSPLMKLLAVAEFLSVSTRTVRRYTDSGKLPARRLPSGQYRYRREDVEALLDAGEAGQE